MTPQELKNSILQLAIQGKLVEQCPEEGTAEELLPLCREDKARSIKEGKYKKEAFRGAIANNDCIPFEIPDSWNWMFVSDMSLFQEGPGILAVDFRITGVPLIRIAGMQTDIVSLEGCNYLDEDMVASKWSHFKLDLGDIVISTSASMDKIAEVNEECVGAIPYTGLIRFKMYGGIDKSYFKLFIKSPCYMKQVNEQKAGGTIKHYGPSHLKNMVIPIPPIAEQKRIVAKLDELLPYIDSYEQAWSKLNDFNMRFPDDMRKSILQMAIKGKLVEQLPEEGTGEELYQHIQAEKAAAHQNGNHKKEKPLPGINEDEKPFNIPESWVWTKLGDISWFFDAGKSPNCEKKNVSGNEWGVITTTAIQLGFLMKCRTKILPSNYEVKNNMQVKTGDILITRAGPTNRTGIACLVKKIRYNLILSDKTLRINMTDQYVCKDFIIMVLNSPQIRQLIIELMSGMDKQQVNISQDKYKTVLIPLPPLAEQKRIVAKLERILPLCGKLK